MTRINITTPETSSISAHLAALSARSLIDSAIDGFRNMDWKTKLIITSSVASIVGKRLYKYWKNRVRRNTIIELDLDFKMIVETPPTRLPIPTPGGDTPHKVCLHDIVDALHRAAKDPRVVGLIVRIGQTTMGLAQAQELRSALVEFKKSGKPAICFAETFGELASGTTSYYVASACELYMCPSGDVNTTGVLAESVFVKNMLDKIGVQIRADKRKEYKNALNTFTEEGFTEAHREAMQRLSDSLFAQIVRDIAQSRGFASEDELRKVIDKGPFIGKEAVDHKLIDGVAYRDEVFDKILSATKTTKKSAHFLFAEKYLERVGKSYTKGKHRIAYIYGGGAVLRAESQAETMWSSSSIGSETVARAFRNAVKDKNIKAIVFRVDSPGGSYVGSDLIWHEIVRAQQAGKKVIVSMGNLAASGGYFVSMAAHKIVADPATITGSIGVFAGKMLTSQMWKKLGVNWDNTKNGAHATIFSTHYDYSEEEWARLQAFLDRVYADFTTKVAAGRNMPIEKVEEVARGRIWTGEDALRLGLVDELGGLHRAIQLAKEAAGIPADATVKLVPFPKKKSLMDLLKQHEVENSDQIVSCANSNALASMSQSARQIKQSAKPFLSVAAAMGMIAGAGASGSNILVTGEPGVTTM